MATVSASPALVAGDVQRIELADEIGEDVGAFSI